ncbi:MAG: hypothetical protein AAGH78_02515 [Cyanobacteria bacterium P01_H01_bin.58]
MSQSNLLEAAKSIRPFLPQLLNEQAQKVDQQLADFIIRYQEGEQVENQIISLLASYDATRQWMREFLGVDAALARSKGYSPLPGIPKIDAPRYACPEGDYIWHHIDSSDPIPTCPTHNCPLIRNEV